MMDQLELVGSLFLAQPVELPNSSLAAMMQLMFIHVKVHVDV